MYTRPGKNKWIFLITTYSKTKVWQSSQIEAFQACLLACSLWYKKSNSLGLILPSVYVLFRFGESSLLVCPFWRPFRFIWDWLGVIACLVDSACLFHISAYKPPSFINSPCVPVSATLPSYIHGKKLRTYHVAPNYTNSLLTLARPTSLDERSKFKPKNLG